MVEEEKVDKALIPYFGEELPKKAHEKALERLKRGGKLFLLHITDTAPTRSIRYQTGQMGEKSEIVKTFRENLQKVQEKAAEEYAEKVKKEAAKRDISIETLYITGNPADEVLNAIKKYSIDLVLIEQLRGKITEVFLGDEINYVCEKAGCEVVSLSN